MADQEGLEEEQPMIKTTKKLCYKCLYSQGINGGGDGVCMYIVATEGLRRGCKFGECNKYKIVSAKEKDRFWRLRNGLSGNTDDNKGYNFATMKRRPI